MSHAAQSQCPRCDAGNADRIYSAQLGRVIHAGIVGKPACRNYDSECRHVAEPIGFCTFAWLPVRCRNGKRRWLSWVERHPDGTYTSATGRVG